MMNAYQVFIYIFLNIICEIQVARSENVEFQNETLSLEEAIQLQELKEKQNPMKSFSRKRRYLVFPEGSSFQVVFCLTYGMVIPISDIFYMGATAALAWQLPQDPYSPFHHHAEALHRMDTANTSAPDTPQAEKRISSQSGSILINRYTGQPIQPRYKDLYMNKNSIKDLTKKISKAKKRRKKILFNPAFAKRSINDSTGDEEHVKKRRATVLSFDRKEMHLYQGRRYHLDIEYMTPESIEFHRFSRTGLYEKIEKLLRGMGNDGRQCVLKTLCEMGQDKSAEQGSFLDELIRVVFTLPSGKQFEAFHQQAYDEAFNTQSDCEQLYPKCISSLKSMPLRRDD